ncbi:hypothetical protein TSUD_55700 [Trifolium subterraneum]|uniref:Uncharacterized protein n=1 Tax=Trifolium subterraneum TaxID=3900 RepID=A0A2Z6M8F3_TRISU|nr:hypothetical protein TSUD_55700 [Trifolium subterraneum]
MIQHHRPYTKYLKLLIVDGVQFLNDIGGHVLESICTRKFDDVEGAWGEEIKHLHTLWVQSRAWFHNIEFTYIPELDTNLVCQARVALRLDDGDVESGKFLVVV